MKKLIPNLLALLVLVVAFLLGNAFLDETNDYWHFLTHHMVLNVGLATIAITAGLLDKNYLYVIIGASFVLLIYCLTYMFSPGSQMISQFFLAIYTIFLAFSVIANLCRHYKDWVLREA
jgi:hypothetical protein